MPVRLLQVTALAAFFCASGAYASSSSSPGGSAAYDAFIGKVYGNSTTVSYGTNGTPLATSSSGLGTPHTYGGVGVDTAEPAVKGKVNVPLGNTGKSVEVVAKSVIPRAGIARGLIKLAKFGAGGVAGYAAGLAAEALLDYGLKNIKTGPDGTLQAQSPDSNSVLSDGNEYYYSDLLGGYSTPQAACNAYALRKGGTFFSVDKDFCTWTNPDGGRAATGAPAKRTSSTCPAGKYWISYTACADQPEMRSMSEQEIYDKIASSNGWPTSSARALAHMLGEPDIRTDLDPQPAGIVGPMTVPGATSKSSESVKLVPGTNVEAPPGATQTDPGTKTTTSTKTHPLEYNGSTVKYGTITNNVTNITNNVTNVTTTETTKTEEKQDDNKPDLCEKHPDTIGCQKIDFDTPEGEIPRKQIDVAWSPVDLGLGGGSCPAPVQLYDNKQFSYQLACDNLLLIKTMVIAIALFVGGMIIFGGRADQ